MARRARVVVAVHPQAGAWDSPVTKATRPPVTMVAPGSSRRPATAETREQADDDKAARQARTDAILRPRRSTQPLTDGRRP